MEILETKEDLSHVELNDTLRKDAKLFDNLIQRSAFDVLEDEVKFVSVDKVGEVFDDVFVVELSQDADLSLLSVSESECECECECE